MNKLITQPSVFRHRLVTAVLALICFWVLVGYRYFVHAGMETVPLVFRNIDPSYLVNDYYLNIISDTLHHRFVFINSLALLSKAIGSVEITMVAVYVFSYLFLFNAYFHNIKMEIILVTYIFFC